VKCLGNRLRVLERSGRAVLEDGKLQHGMQITLPGLEKRQDPLGEALRVLRCPCRGPKYLPADPVRRRTSQPSAVICIHVPTFEMNVPARKIR